MIITWLGEYCVRLERGEVSILFDPPSGESKLKVPRNGTSVLILSGSSSFREVGRFEKSFLVTGPGEYDVNGLFIRGMGIYSGLHKSQKSLTMFLLEFDGLTTLFIPAFVPVPLPDELLEEVGDVDILFLPVGGKGVSLEADAAEKLVRQIEPRLAIPTNHHIPGIGTKLDKVDAFLKYMGEKTVESLPKLSIKKKELPQEAATKVVVLKPL